MRRGETISDHEPNQLFRELGFKDFQRNETLGIGIPVVVIVKDTERVTRQRRLVDMYSQHKKVLRKNKYSGSFAWFRICH